MGNENELEGVQGSCLCGSVRFELLGKINGFYFCHCMRCRRSTGSAHSSNIFTDPENIRWLSGQELIKRYELPEAERFAKQFCIECGSPSPWSTGMAPNSSSRQELSSKVLKPIPRKTSSGIRRPNGTSMGWKLQSLRSIKSVLIGFG